MFQRIGAAAYKIDLSNTVAFCDHLGNPEQDFKSIHIAGTNGKGSSAHMLASALQATGYKTGLYTSPHFKRFTERIKINREEMSDDAVVKFVRENKAFIKKLQPSFFEVTVGMAFKYFADAGVDIAVVEVGLGGRLDSTNILQPEVALITNIGLDHQYFLGNSLPEIAGEKGGIIKPHTPVVIGEYNQETAPVFAKIAQDKNAPIYFADKKYHCREISRDISKIECDIYRGDKLYLKGLVLDSAGIYQLKNLPGVLQSLELLKSHPTGELAMREGLANIRRNTGLKGRWQVIGESPLIICDTAHNAEGMKVVKHQLDHLSYKKLHIVLGIVKDKSPEDLLNILPEEAIYYFCKPDIPRGLEAEKLAEVAREAGRVGSVAINVDEAVKKARATADPEDLIFIGGSSFVVAELEAL